MRTTDEAKLREKWKKEVERTGDIGLAMFGDSTADWFISEFNQMMEKKREEVKRMKAEGTYLAPFDVTLIDADQVLKALSEE